LTTNLFVIIKLYVVFLMDTSELGDHEGREIGYLYHTLQSTVWEQEGILLSFMALHDHHNHCRNVLSQ